ncbi:hypothetical protein G3N95_10200 [Paraburkholderia sp. Tr-20389]|uniref:hypothetical protein n=1 Tax=Paraburkholderia sp. Tr-20389 TaxID=2703903 RepID=UPI0019821B78|nr:hypothetical protein [Paraburkholderia sp. Tr-20389]MBN3753315.1 hypothetical protein [Paraburkholderia sp. Tr-20389]
MDQQDGFKGRTPFYLCMMAEEQDEALADVMALAKPGAECELRAALDALAEIHELVKSYLDAV